MRHLLVGLVLPMASCWPYIPPGLHAPGTQVWGSISIVHPINGIDNDPETSVRAVFLDEPHGVWNLAECLDGDLTCAIADLAPDASIPLSDVPRLGRRAETETLRVNGKRVPKALSNSGRMHEAVIDSYGPADRVVIEVDGARLSLDQEIVAPDLPDIRSPELVGLTPLENGSQLVVEWEPGGLGQPYLEVRPLHSGASSRFFLFEDDGYTELGMDKLDIPDVDEVHLVFGRQARTTARDTKHEIDVLVRTEAWIQAVRVPAGAIPLEAGQACTESVEENRVGTFYGTVPSDPANLYEPGPAGECAGIQAAGNQRWIRHYLVGADTAAILRLQRPGYTPILYGYEWWYCWNSNVCVPGQHTDPTLSALYLVRGPEDRHHRIALDAAEPDATGVFVLDIDHVSLPEKQEIEVEWTGDDADGDHMELTIWNAADTHYRLSLVHDQGVLRGEDCHGIGIMSPTGEMTQRCHEFSGSTLTLDTRRHWDAVETGSTTMAEFWSVGNVFGNNNYLLEGVNTGFCWVWGGTWRSYWNDWDHCQDITDLMRP